MGCLVLFVGLVAPRAALVLMWIFSHWIGRAFDGGILLPVLGFLFLPYTLLWYVVVLNAFHAQWGLWQVLILVLAILADFSSHGGSARAARRRR